MRKLSVFLLLPLLSLPLRTTKDLRNRLGDPSRAALTRGDLARVIASLARRSLNAPRRLLTPKATEPEIHVIAAKAHAEATQATPPVRRPTRRILVPRLLPSTPRMRPQTT
jgi:hypothetical protein